MSRLLVISPVRNEADRIPALVRSVAAQDRVPDLWLVVDDSSDDGTLTQLREAAARHDFMRVLSAPSNGMAGDDESRLARAAEARAFNWALAQIGDHEYGYVAKLDGDIELPPDYYARVIQAFETEPALAVAGGRFAERSRRGDWQVVRVPHHHVPGALKVYRRQFLVAVGGIREHLGWDTIDETTARMRGFATRSLPDLVARHHRPMGSVGGRLRGRARYGTCAYAARYGPGWVALRSLKVGALPPFGLSGIAFLYGYGRAAVRRVPRVEDRDYRRFVRRELRARLTGALPLRRG